MTAFAAALVLLPASALAAPPSPGEGADSRPGSLAPRSGERAGERGLPPELKELLARVDAEWARRDEPGRMQQIESLLARAEKAAPDAYDVLWRVARLEFWRSDDPAFSNEEKSRLGKKTWEYGDRAARANPDGVEGWYFAAVGMGNYALGIGVLKALSEGIEGKFRERLSRAEKIDPRFYAGGVYNAWGRFYFKLPWPKFDARRSEQALLKALELNPSNVRARVFLAELYMKTDHPKEARTLLEEAAAHEPGSYDIPEERRSRDRARELLSQTKK